MARDGYSTGINDLRTGVQHLRDTHETIKGYLRTLDNLVNDLNGRWIGGAKESFTGLNNRFDAQALKLNNAVDLIGDELDKTANRMDQQEATQSSNFSNISNRLDA